MSVRSSSRRSNILQGQSHGHVLKDTSNQDNTTNSNIAKTIISGRTKREVFITELAHFHKTTGSPIRNKPVVNGKEVDLYLLYTLVQNNGGWLKLNSLGTWDTLLQDLGLPSPCVNGGVAIRQIYLRHLERWDRAKNASMMQGGGGDNDMMNAEADDDRPRRGAWGTPKPRNTVAQSYNQTQHNVPEHVRESVGLAPLQKLGGPVERLSLSLLSPFPNEQDFALNVCTILAADSANKLPVTSCPYIIDFLLGHVSIYNHQSLRDVIGKSYKEARNIDMKCFWEEHTRPAILLELLDEGKFPIQGLAMQALVSEINLNNCLTEGRTDRLSEEKDVQQVEEQANILLADEDGLLASYCNGGARDVISRRVSQVAQVMRNLSFHDENLAILAKNLTFMRFSLLCANTSMSSIRQMGLDALGNVAQDMTIKDPTACILSKHLFSTITTSLASDDRARILSALEILNKLAQNEVNEDVLLRCLESNVYEQVCSYLTLHDIMLLVVTLECMYALTSLGEKACDYIVRVHGVMDTLVSLITVEAQSYGPKACILMRVVETVPGGQMLPQYQPQVAPAPRPLTPPVSNLTNLSSVQMQLQSGAMPLAPQQLIQTVQQGQQKIETLQLQTNKPASSAPAATVTVQQQHAQQQVIQENEQFALAWLRTTWEPCPTNIRLDSAELYKQYMACCAKVGRKGVISPLHFPRCVRSVFGGMVGPNVLKGPNGEVQQFYVGIRQRPAVNKPSQPNAKAGMFYVLTNTAETQLSRSIGGPASPILKAQLCKLELKPPTNPHPHLSMALEGGVVNPAGSPPPVQQTVSTIVSQNAPGVQNITPSLNSNPPSQSAPSNTTLIKHLLAHKVSPVPSTIESDRMIAQVAQRQNQQRLMNQTGNPQPPQPVVQTPPTTSTVTAVPMEIDAEALISCSTITSSGVTSTAPSGSPLIVAVPPLAPLTQVASEDNLKIEAPVQGVVTTTTIEESQLVNNNKMLTDLLEKQSVPPLITSASPAIIKQLELTDAPAKSNEDENDEPEAKKPRESVSSKAANLYAALAADALEDEEDMLLNQTDANQATNIAAPTVAIEDPSVLPVVAQVIQAAAPSTGIPQQIMAPEVQDASEGVRQVIVPTLSNHGGQIILHAAQKPVTANVPTTPFLTTQPGQIQLVASANPQGMDYGGVVSHKTIIIVQNSNGGPPMSVTLNNPGGTLDEATLGNLIAQATNVINQQQAANQSAVIQTSGLLQTSTGVIQTNQPAGLIQTNVAGQPSIIGGVIKQQLVTGQQPQQLIATAGGHQIIVQGNQAILASNSSLLGNQKIILNNQQMMIGGQQIVMSNPVTGQQQVITGQLINNPQQIVTVSQPFQTGTQQQIVVAGQPQQPRIVQQPQPPPPPPSPPRKIPDEPWVCVWKGCDQVFESAAAVYSHACQAHCVLQESPCMWLYCDQLPRKKFSLMTHLQDRHCNSEALKASLAQRRKGIVPQSTTTTTQGNPSATMERIDSPAPDAPTGITHPGYAPNAALHAIKRHAVDFLNPRELMNRAAEANKPNDPPDDNEGPVTKSIRLTAALILRNIVLYSHSGKRLLRGYEPHLAGIALSSVEASRTVAQVLYDMNSI